MKKKRLCAKDCRWRELVQKAEFFGKQTAVARTEGTSAQLLATLKAAWLSFRCLHAQAAKVGL